VEHGTSRGGRWLRVRRFRIALSIAVIEAVLAAFTAGVSRWTIILLAAISMAVYFFFGRARQGTVHQVTWIAAASQALALVAVSLAFFIGTFVLIVAGIFAIVALVMIFSDRG
ncbi:MAG: hypothetical protein ACJ76O_09075, partial [Gaiellaceae bacterium]